MEAALYEQTFAVVDVETTGLSARMGDRICEVAVVIARGGKIVDHFHRLVNPQRSISRGAAAVNGITAAMVRDEPTFNEVAQPVAKALDGAVLVAHNASFDMAFLSAEMRAAGYAPPANPVVDTLALARRCYTFPSNSLGDIARYLGISTRGLHRALADATITWEVLKRFLWDLQSQGVTTLDALLKLQGSITSPAGWYMTPPLMEWDGGEFNPIQGLPPIIEQALRSRSRLRIKYVGSDGKQSERLVQPSKVTLREQATYLVAFCHSRGEERTFRLDRIIELKMEA